MPCVSYDYNKYIQSGLTSFVNLIPANVGKDGIMCGGADANTIYSATCNKKIN